MPEKKYMGMSFITILYYLELAFRIYIMGQLAGCRYIHDVFGIKHQFGLSIQGDFVAVIAFCNTLN